MSFAQKICPILALLLATPLSAAPGNDNSALAKIPGEFSGAWARGDGRALGKLMSEDVDFVTVGATWLHGRRDFSVYHSRLLSERFRGSTITPLTTKVRVVRPGLAV